MSGTSTFVEDIRSKLVYVERELATLKHANHELVCEAAKVKNRNRELRDDVKKLKGQVSALKERLRERSEME